jgi:hypothetical protein
VQLYGTFALADDSQADPPNRYVARWRDAKTFPASGSCRKAKGARFPHCPPTFFQMRRIAIGQVFRSLLISLPAQQSLDGGLLWGARGGLQQFEHRVLLD